MVSVLTVLAVSGFVAFWTLVLAIAARRFLQLRAGRLRVLLSGVLGLAVAALAVGQRMQNDTERAAFIFLWVGIGVLSAMGSLVLTEIIAPAGTRPRPVRWYRAFRRWRQRARRYSEITRIAVRHGLNAYTTGRRGLTAQARNDLARQLRLALEEAGVVFVKFGQILSTRHDLLPREFVDELSRLRTRAAPLDWTVVESVISEELGAPVDEVFAHVDHQPLASASIAQVHRGRLHSGEQVAVKVQRPGIDRVVADDLDITVRIAGMLHRRARWAMSIGIRDLADGFADALREELDFTVEARNMTGISGVRSYDDVAMPRPRADLCTRRVLVMDYLDGLPLDRATSIVDEHGPDRIGMARTLLHTLLSQIMFDGVFLADPHPGNLMLLRDGRLGLLDFGSVGRLDPGLRTTLQRLVLAIDAGDAAALTDALMEAVDHPEEIDHRRLERAIGRFMARHLSPVLPADIDMFTDMFRLVARYGVAVPPELAAVFRALATLEGTLAQLAPGFNIVDESRAFATAHLHQAMLPGSLRATAMAELVNLLPLIRRLPRRLDRLSSAFEHGRLTAGVRLFADHRDRHVVTHLVHQTLITVLAAATGIIAAAMLGTTGGPRVAPDLTLYDLIAYSLLILSGGLTLRILTSIMRTG